MPVGWEQATAKSGRLYFIDHNTRTSTWLDPRTHRPAHTTNPTDDKTAVLGLPAGWEQETSKDGRVYFINHNDHITTWMDPRSAEAMTEREVSLTMGPLPEGWTTEKTPSGSVVFTDHVGRRTIWLDPRRAVSKL